ncbi:hypothetical protein JKP88DRAFT_295942 [Tribonema minus]|uniref:Uncharacterized protein n=1 Tax=Tribonema minus TaxID=303371 RepID=A0A835ZMN7_9STRA|nr:hypothetical protein JKP88DRAFT_295942 [Tribonema minus]
MDAQILRHHTPHHSCRVPPLKAKVEDHSAGCCSCASRIRNVTSSASWDVHMPECVEMARRRAGRGAAVIGIILLLQYCATAAPPATASSLAKPLHDGHRRALNRVVRGGGDGGGGRSKGVIEAPAARQDAAPSLGELVKFTLPLLVIWLSNPVMSLIDTSVVGKRSLTQLAALGPGTSVCDNISCKRVRSVRQYFMQVLLCIYISTPCGVNGDGALLTDTTITAPSRNPLSPTAHHPLTCPPPQDMYTFLASVGRRNRHRCQLTQTRCFRADLKTPLRVCGVTALTNLVFDITLVMGYGWGIAGAAAATTAAQVMYGLFVLFCPVGEALCQTVQANLPALLDRGAAAPPPPQQQQRQRAPTLTLGPRAGVMLAQRDVGALAMIYAFCSCFFGAALMALRRRSDLELTQFFLTHPNTRAAQVWRLFMTYHATRCALFAARCAWRNRDAVAAARRQWRTPPAAAAAAAAAGPPAAAPRARTPSRR